MADWCIPKIHPFIREMVSKYGLTAKDAKTVIQTARLMDPSLKDEKIEFSDFEESEAFKQAMETYRADHIDIENIMSGAESNEESSKALLREIFGDGVNLETRDEVYGTIKTSQLSTQNINNVFRSFSDARRLDFIGEYICRRVSETITKIQTDKRFRDKYKLKDFNTRGEYYNDQKTKDFVRAVVLTDFKKAISNLKSKGKDTLASELEAAIDNYNTILYMYGSEIFRNEKVKVDINGDMRVDDTPYTSYNKNDSDEDTDEDDDDVEMEERPVGDFKGVSDQNKSVYSKIVPDIKVLLANCRDGKDKFGYGLPKYISVSAAMNRLHTICDGCESSSEMMSVLKDAAVGEPWIMTVYNALDDSTDIDITKSTSSSSSRKEQLRTMAFQSFVKPFTKFRQTYQEFDNGDMAFRNSFGNLRIRSESMSRYVRTAFRRMSGAKIFKDLKLSKENIDSLVSEITTPRGANMATSQSIQARLIMNQSEAYNDYAIDNNADMSSRLETLDGIKKELVSLVNEFGIPMTANDINAYSSKPVNLGSISDLGGDVASVMTQTNNLLSLINGLGNIAKNLNNWIQENAEALRKSGVEEKDIDSESTLNNPFTQKQIDNQELFNAAKSLKSAYNSLINSIAEVSPESEESSAWMGGKTYYSRNNPSTIGDMIDHLTNMDDTARKDYIKEKYCRPGSWFVKSYDKKGNPHFYSDWLEGLYYGNITSQVDYSEKPLINKKSYGEVSDIEYVLSMLGDFFSKNSAYGPETAWYRVLIASDKPKYSSIKGPKIQDDLNTSYKKEIANKAVEFYSQELRRAESVARFAAFGQGTRVYDYDIIHGDNEDQTKVIDKMREKKKVTISDVVKNGRYVFENTGAGFQINKFINNEIARKTDVGKKAVDIIFNSHMHTGKLNGSILTAGEIGKYKDVFHKYMEDVIQRNFDEYDRLELFDAKNKTVKGDEGVYTVKVMKHLYGSILKWNEENPNIIGEIYADREGTIDRMKAEYGYTDELIQKNPADVGYFQQIYYFKDKMLPQFVYNNWIAKANMSQILDVDLAFYKNTVNFQKRNAQIVSSGYIADPSATIHGDPVSDGKYRSITIMTPRQSKSEISSNIKVMFEREIEREPDPRVKQKLRESLDDVIKKLTNYDSTDGQAFTGLTALRKRMVGRGEWTRSNDKKTDEDGKIEINGKPYYIHTDEAVYQRLKRKDIREIIEAGDFFHVFGQPEKPFTYAFTNISREDSELTVPVQHKNSEYLLAYMSAFINTSERPKTVTEAIARFLEETAEDNPLTGVDTVNFDSGVKIGNTDDMIDLSDLTGEDAGHEALKRLRASMYEVDENGEYTGKKKTRKINNVVTEYDIRDYKIVQKKPEHFKRNAQPLGTQFKILAINNIKDNARISMPDGSTITGKELKSQYLDALSKKMAKSEEEFRSSIGLNLPHDKRIHRLSVMLKRAMATDQKFDAEMRKALSLKNKDGKIQFEVPLDDVAVQGAVESMLLSKIRRTFYKNKTNGGIVVQATAWGSADDLRVRFYSSNLDDEDGLIPVDADEDYVRKYQRGYAHFECEMPMPDYVKRILASKSGGLRAFMNNDGTWDMEKIKMNVPDSVFDCIAYRIPTQSKSFMMAGRIKRFTPEWAGSVGKFPKELTVLTDSDFDIDTDFVELRPIPGSPDSSIDNKIFDLQLAALRSGSGSIETFRPGDFTDLSELSYYVTLLRNGYTPRQLDGMTAKQLKNECMRVEDMDLMDPWTDVMLKKQNSDAKEMIAIAAVGTTSHAFISLYNDSAYSENRITLKIYEGNGDTLNESFTVINDRYEKKDKAPKMEIKDDITLDPTHDMDGNLIGNEISKYVGASADAAKDAAMYRLNITQKTLPVLITMHRMGISSDVARMFISQPIIREFFDELNSKEAFNYVNMKDALQNFADKYIADNGVRTSYSEQCKNTNISLVFSELADDVTKPTRSKVEGEVISNVKKLRVLDTLMDIQRKVSNLDSFTRYNSMNAMRGSSYLERLVGRQKLKRLMDNIDKPESRIRLPKNIAPKEGAPGFEYAKLFTMFPYIGDTISGEDDLIENVILEEMRTYGQGFFDMARKLHLLDDNERMEDVKTLRTLYNGWKGYLMFVGDNRIADFRDRKTAEKYTVGFYDHYVNFINNFEKENPKLKRELIDNNEFIKRIYIEQLKPEFGGFDYLATDINRLKGRELEIFKRDWESLLDHPETRQFAIDVSIHFLARSAGFANNTPVAVMPLRIREAIPNYTKVYTDADKSVMTENDEDHFMRLFMRNNTDKSKRVVPRLYKRKDGRFVYEIDKEKGKLKLPASSRIAADWIDGPKGAKVMTLPVIILDDDVYEITSGNFTIEKDENNDNFYVFDVTSSSPMGVPNQFSEYVGEYIYNYKPAESSLFKPAGNAERSQSADIADGDSLTNEVDEGDAQMFRDEIFNDKRAGSFFSSEPFGSDSGVVTENLAKDKRDYDNGFLESRKHLKRISWVSDMMGFKSENTQRGTIGDATTYFIGLTPKNISGDQHEHAKKTAAIANALGFRESDETVVKTYVSDYKKSFNAVEFNLKFGEGRLQQRLTQKYVRDNLSNDIYDIVYNNDRNELQITMRFDDDSFEMNKDRLAKAINAMKGMVANLKSKGVNISGELSANLLMYDKMSKDDVRKTIENINNGIEQGKQNGVENPGNAESGRNKGGNKVGIGDIIPLALRRVNGENVEKEIMELFGESGSTLGRLGTSYMSSLLINEMEDSDTYNEASDLLEQVNPEADIDSMIIRVANWIITKGDNQRLRNAIVAGGLSEELADNVMIEVKDILEELNIC